MNDIRQQDGTSNRLGSDGLFGAYSRKEKAWRKYKAAECFDSDGKANAFSKGFDAGEVITPDKWNDLVGERDHLLGAIRVMQRIWQTQSEACADNSRAAELMAEQARSATAYLDSPNDQGQTRSAANTEK